MAISKKTISWVRSLQQKKFRQKYNKFIVEGDKIVKEVLSQQKDLIHSVYASASWIETNKSIISVPDHQLFSVSTNEMSRISNLKTPSNALVVLQQTPNDNITLPANGMTLYLDDIQDPGNLGTILRIADWFGIEYVLRSPQTVDLYNPKVLQSTMGAFLRIKSPIISLEEIHQQCPHLPILGAILNGDNVYSFQEQTVPSILVIGNEGKGISPQNINLLTHKITIPRPVNGGAESLNAAVATGILCGILLGK